MYRDVFSFVVADKRIIMLTFVNVIKNENMLSLDDNKITYQYHLCQQCGACREVCPVGAIAFEALDNGLKLIVVDHDKCIKCKRCVNVCPSRRALALDSATVENGRYLSELADKQYRMACNSDDKVRRAASSGGVARTLIVEGLRSGYVDAVYALGKADRFPFAQGTIYTRDNIPEYGDLPTSVYHSVMACNAVKEMPKVHRLMIVGTSCQLYALEKSLRGKYDELVKVCIFCKQQKTFDSTRFMAKMMGVRVPADKNVRISYRGEGWHGIVRVGDGSMPWNRAATIPFGRRLWCVPGCNVCGDPFGMECGADLSLMDPWVIRKPTSLGETLVTVHTPIGEELMDVIPMLKVESIDYEEARPALGINDIWRKRLCVPYFMGGKCSVRSQKAGEAEERQRRLLTAVVERLPRMPLLFYRSLNRLVPDRCRKIASTAPLFGNAKDVKVITRHIPSNYGSLLQSIATLEVLETFGCDARIIDYRRPDDRSWLKVVCEAKKKHSNPLKRLAYIAIRYPIEKFAERRFDNMRGRYLRTTEVMTTHEQLAGLKADLFLTGSDQVWGPMVDGELDTAYFLDFAHGAVRRAYSASFGRTEFTEDTVARYKTLLGNYDKIAVREDSAVEKLKSWGVDSCVGQVLDPVLLLTKEQWSGLLELDALPKENDGRPYILVYELHNNPQLDDYAKRLAAHAGMELRRVSPFAHHRGRGGKFELCPDVRRFVKLVADAECVVTDSFHGTCVAITFQKRFVDILPGVTATRNQSILKKLGLTDRILSDYEDYALPFASIDYGSVISALAEERVQSMKIIKETINE